MLATRVPGFKYYLASTIYSLGTNNGGSGNGGNAPNPATNGNGNSPNGSNGGSNNNSAKIEQLSSMREALYSQDGWGGVSIFRRNLVCIYYGVVGELKLMFLSIL